MLICFGCFCLFRYFTGTASILGYLIFILRLGSIITYFNQIFLILSNQLFKRVFRFLTTNLKKLLIIHKIVFEKASDKS